MSNEKQITTGGGSPRIFVFFARMTFFYSSGVVIGKKYKSRLKLKKTVEFLAKLKKSCMFAVPKLKQYEQRIKKSPKILRACG